MTPARDTLLANMPEFQWQAQVEEWARQGGWLYFHLPACEHNRRAKGGFPDLCLIHPERRIVFFLELKRKGEKPRPKQQAWLDAAKQAHDIWASWADPTVAAGVRAVLLDTPEFRAVRDEAVGSPEPSAELLGREAPRVRAPQGGRA